MKMKSDWTDTICSAVTYDFISNPFPKNGETISISFRVRNDAPVISAKVKGLMHGERFDSPAARVERFERFTYYTAEVTVTGDELRYWFVIESEEGFLYLCSAGLSTVPFAERDAFRLLIDLDCPSWVPGAVFYQIFPDRFRSGDESLGVKPAEYAFDGADTQALSWDAAPPEFEEGRCVDFYNGDLKGISDAIPHFRELSVDALYLNPIFSGKTNHRYDCTDYFHVDEHLGGDEALCELSENLHENDMHMIVDVSINHTGTDHTWFKKASADKDSEEAKYYYRNPDGSFACWYDVPTLPQLNYGAEVLRQRIWKDSDALVRHYIKPPFSIDGWRFDVANEVGRRGEDQYCHEIWQEVRKAVKAENADSYIIGEHWEDASEYIQGDQWDGTMNYFGSGRPARGWMGELDRFLTENWGHDPKAGRPYTGFELQQFIEAGMVSLPDQLRFFQYNLIDSHDTPRLHHHEAVWGMQNYAAALYLLFTIPGAASYFYGDEIGIAGHPKSIEGSRYPMVWDREQWDMGFFELYKGLGALRAAYRELFAYGAFRTLEVTEESYCCARFTGTEAMLTLLNRETEQKTYRIDVSPVGLCDAALVMGEGQCELAGEELILTLPAGGSVMVYGKAVK